MLVGKITQVFCQKTQNNSTLRRQCASIISLPKITQKRPVKTCVTSVDFRTVPCDVCAQHDTNREELVARPGWSHRREEQPCRFHYHLLTRHLPGKVFGPETPLQQLDELLVINKKQSSGTNLSLAGFTFYRISSGKNPIIILDGEEEE